MKLTKKLVSAVAALAMATSAFVGLTAYAEGTTLTGSAELAGDKSYVTLKFEYADAPANSKVSIIHVKAEESIFDLSGLETAFTTQHYDEEEEEYIDATLDSVIGDYPALGLSSSLSATRKKAFKLSFNIDDEITLQYNGGNLKTAETNFITIKVPVKNASALEDGYEFTVSASNIGSSTQNTNTLTVVSPSLEGQGPITYTVTAGENVTVKKGDTPVTEAAEGDELTFEAADRSAENYQFVKFTVNGEDATSTYTMGTEAISVAAVYEYVAPKAEATFEVKEATAHNAVGFAATLTSLLNATDITKAGFVFANLTSADLAEQALKYDDPGEVDTTITTTEMEVDKAPAGVGEAFTYEFKNLTGFDKFGLKAMAYIVTDNGVCWSPFFGSLITIDKD